MSLETETQPQNLEEEEIRVKYADWRKKLDEASSAAQLTAFKVAKSRAYQTGGPIEFWVGGEKYIINFGYNTLNGTLYWQGRGEENPDWARVVFQIPNTGGGVEMKPLVSYQSLEIFSGPDRPGERKPIKNTPLAARKAEELVDRFCHVIKSPVGQPSIVAA